jgi:predicted RNA-binding protein associated with RNAse of E/G family
LPPGNTHLRLHPALYWSAELARSETINFEFQRYNSFARRYENDLVAALPGLLITQFVVPQSTLSCFNGDRLALRFDFIDDWYCVMAFLDDDGKATGHYRVDIQTPLQNEDGVWKGDHLLLGLVIKPDFHYTIVGEEEFLTAFEDGWMKVYSAAKAREALRSLCTMVDQGALPQEVMDAVHG